MTVAMIYPSKFNRLTAAIAIAARRFALPLADAPTAYHAAWKLPQIQRPRCFTRLQNVPGQSVSATMSDRTRTLHPEIWRHSVASVSSASVRAEKPPMSRSAAVRQIDAAPGTVSTTPNPASASRSRFSTYSYSLACTDARKPASTATIRHATAASRFARHTPSRQFAGKLVSASSSNTKGAAVDSTPVRTAAAFPRLSEWRSSRAPVPRHSSISSPLLPSRDPSSTTQARVPVRRTAARLAPIVGRWRRSLNAGMTTSANTACVVLAGTCSESNRRMPTNRSAQ